MEKGFKKRQIRQEANASQEACIKRQWYSIRKDIPLFALHDRGRLVLYFVPDPKQVAYCPFCDL